MRIIAGSRKGARIFAPKGLGTRPTSDRVREAAFTLIPPGYAEDATVLDLFAGSGSTLIACEQLGRRCYAVELDPRYCDVIRRRYQDYSDGR